MLCRHAHLKLDLHCFSCSSNGAMQWVEGTGGERHLLYPQHSTTNSSVVLWDWATPHQDCNSVNANSESQLFCWLFLFKAFAVSTISPVWGRPFQRPWLAAVLWPSEECGSALQTSWVPHTHAYTLCFLWAAFVLEVCTAILSLHIFPFAKGHLGVLLWNSKSSFKASFWTLSKLAWPSQHEVPTSQELLGALPLQLEAI